MEYNELKEEVVNTTTEFKDKEQEEREIAEFVADVFGGNEFVEAPKQAELNHVFDKEVPDITDLLKQDRLDYLSRHPDAVERDFRAEKMRSQGFSRGPDVGSAKVDDNLIGQIAMSQAALGTIWEMISRAPTNQGSAERPKFKVSNTRPMVTMTSPDA